MVMPGAITGDHQPLDKYFFRPFKYINRKIILRQNALASKHPDKYMKVHEATFERVSDASRDPHIPTAKSRCFTVLKGVTCEPV